MNDRIDLEPIKATAKAATPGERRVYRDSFSTEQRIIRAETEDDARIVGYSPNSEDAAYIAMMDTPTTLALVEELEGLRAMRERLIEWERAHRVDHTEHSGEGCGLSWTSREAREVAELLGVQS